MLGLPSWSSLLSAEEWGWKWNDEYMLGDRPRAPPAPPLPPPPPARPFDYEKWLYMLENQRSRTVGGPLGVLAALAISIALNNMYGRQIGDVACAWRVEYSPDSRVFGIWTLIYTWMAFSVVSQLISAFGEHTYAAEAWTNYLVAYSWMLCGVWTFFFSGSANSNRRTGVVLGAFILTSSCLCAVGAVAIEHSWRSPTSAWRIVGVGVPYSLFAGWLCVATALNMGTATLALHRNADNACRYQGERYSTLVEASPSESVSLQSWVPFTVALLISICAFLLPDPILPIPLLVAIAFMKGHLKHWMALELLGLSVAVCGVMAAFQIHVF